MVAQYTQHSDIYHRLQPVFLLVLADFTNYPFVACLRTNWLRAFLAHLIAHTYSSILGLQSSQLKHIGVCDKILLKEVWHFNSRNHVLLGQVTKVSKFLFSRQREVPLKPSLLILLQLRGRYLTKGYNNALVDVSSSHLSFLASVLGRGGEIKVKVTQRLSWAGGAFSPLQSVSCNAEQTDGSWW